MASALYTNPSYSLPDDATSFSQDNDNTPEDGVDNEAEEEQGESEEDADEEDQDTTRDATDDHEHDESLPSQGDDADMTEGSPDRRRSRASRGGAGASGGLSSSSYHHLRIRATPSLPLVSDPSIAPTVREIGKDACWSLSTAKPGNGVDQLRDSSLDTYWQSDGLQPHYINIQFPRRQTVCAIALYMDFNLDESYTPKRLKVRVGTTFHNLEEVRVVEVREPVGWCTIPLWRKWGEDVIDSILDPDGGNDDEDDEEDLADGTRRRKKKKSVPLWKRKPLRTHFVQIGITSMHQNGRDTHIRQVKIFGPREGVGGGYGYAASNRGLSSSAGAAGSGRGESQRGAAIMVGNGKLSVPAFQTVGMSQFSTIR